LPGVYDEVSGRLLNAARDGIVIIDETQRVVMMSPAAQRMFGFAAEDALGSELARFIPQRYRAAHREHMRRFDDSGKIEVSMGECRPVIGLRASGEEFPLAITVSRADGTGPFASGRFSTALMVDLSVECDLRARFDALWQRFQEIFELSPTAAWITEGERIVFANKACVALFGAASREGLIGRSIYSLLRPESHAAVRCEVGQALAQGATPALLRERIERLDGTVRDVEIVLAPLPDHGRTTLQMVLSDVTQRRNEALESARSRAGLRALSERLVEAREYERRRIARELHDELGQRLTALKMELASLQPNLRARAGGERIGAMLEMLDETVASVRRISADLRPLMLDDLGVNVAIEWLASDAARRTGVKIAVQLDEADPPLGDRATIALYRMVQEALTNVARHARATRVRIRIRQTGDTLVLTVHDNGVGFSEQAMQKEGSFGLLGIRERAYMLGGEMEVDNPPGGGGRVTVRLPLRLMAAGAGELSPSSAP